MYEAPTNARFQERIYYMQPYPALQEVIFETRICDL